MWPKVNLLLFMICSSNILIDHEEVTEGQRRYTGRAPKNTGIEGVFLGRRPHGCLAVGHRENLYYDQQEVLPEQPCDAFVTWSSSSYRQDHGVRPLGLPRRSARCDWLKVRAQPNGRTIDPSPSLTWDLWSKYRLVMGSPSNHSLSLKIYPVKISGTNG